MTPRARRVLGTFRRQLQGRVTVRRGSGSTAIENDVRARVVGYSPDELVGDVQQGDRKIVALAEDITLDGGIRQGDRIMWRGEPLSVEAVDDSTGDIDGSLVVLYVRARGH